MKEQVKFTKEILGLDNKPLDLEGYDIGYLLAGATYLNLDIKNEGIDKCKPVLKAIVLYKNLGRKRRTVSIDEIKDAPTEVRILLGESFESTSKRNNRTGNCIDIGLDDEVVDYLCAKFTSQGTFRDTVLTEITKNLKLLNEELKKYFTSNSSKDVSTILSTRNELLKLMYDSRYGYNPIMFRAYGYSYDDTTQDYEKDKDGNYKLYYYPRKGEIYEKQLTYSTWGKDFRITVDNPRDKYKITSVDTDVQMMSDFYNRASKSLDIPTFSRVSLCREIVGDKKEDIKYHFYGYLSCPQTAILNENLFACNTLLGKWFVENGFLSRQGILDEEKFRSNFKVKDSSADLTAINLCIKASIYYYLEKMVGHPEIKGTYNLNTTGIRIGRITIPPNDTRLTQEGSYYSPRFAFSLSKVTANLDDIMECGVCEKKNLGVLKQFVEGYEQKKKTAHVVELKRIVAQINQLEDTTDKTALTDEEKTSTENLIEAKYSLDSLGAVRIKAIGDNTKVLKPKNKGIKTIPTDFATKNSSIADNLGNITHIILPPTVTEILQNAFKNFKNLQYIDASACTNLEFIGDWAFEDLKELTVVKLPPHFKVIHKKAFSGCTQLEELDINCDELKGSAFANTKIGKLKLNAKIVGSDAFNGAKIGEIELGTDFEVLGKKSFYGVFAGKTHTFDLPKLRKIGSSALNIGSGNNVNNTELESTDLIIELPKTVNDIDSAAFNGFTKVVAPFNVDEANKIKLGESGVFTGIKELWCYKESAIYTRGLIDVTIRNIHLLDNENSEVFETLDLINALEEALGVSPDDSVGDRLAETFDESAWNTPTTYPFADLLTPSGVVKNHTVLKNKITLGTNSKFSVPIVSLGKSVDIPAYDYILLSLISFIGVELDSQQLAVLESSNYYVTNLIKPVKLYESNTSAVYRTLIATVDMEEYHNLYIVVACDEVHIFIGKSLELNILCRDNLYENCANNGLTETKLLTGSPTYIGNENNDIPVFDYNGQTRLQALKGDTISDRGGTVGYKRIANHISRKFIDTLIANSVILSYSSVRLQWYLPKIEWNLGLNINPLKDGSISSATISESDSMTGKQYLKAVYESLKELGGLDKQSVATLIKKVQKKQIEFSTLGKITNKKSNTAVMEFAKLGSMSAKILDDLTATSLVTPRGITPPAVRKKNWGIMDKKEFDGYICLDVRPETGLRRGDKDALGRGNELSRIYALEKDGKPVKEYFGDTSFDGLTHIMETWVKLKSKGYAGITLGKSERKERFIKHLSLNVSQYLLKKRDVKATTYLSIDLDGITDAWYLCISSVVIAKNYGTNKIDFNYSGIVPLLPIARVNEINKLSSGGQNNRSMLDGLKDWLESISLAICGLYNNTIDKELKEKYANYGQSNIDYQNLVAIMNTLNNGGTIDRKSIDGKLNFFIESYVADSLGSASVVIGASSPTNTGVSTIGINLPPSHTSNSVDTFGNNKQGYVLTNSTRFAQIEITEKDIANFNLLADYGITDLKSLKAYLVAGDSDKIYARRICTDKADLNVFNETDKSFSIIVPKGRVLIGADHGAKGLIVISTEELD